MDRRFQTFLAVVETGSITAAADRLAISQPTLTKRMQLLEQELGCRLIERGSRGISLTRAGKELLPYARRMSFANLQGREAIRAIKSGHLDVFRIGTGPLFQLRYIDDVLDALRKEFGSTRLSVVTDFNERLLPGLTSGILDVVLGTRVGDGLSNGLEFRKMLSVEQGVILPASHSLAKSDIVYPRDMTTLPWVIFSNANEPQSAVANYFTSHGYTPPDDHPRDNIADPGISNGARLRRCDVATAAIAVEPQCVRPDRATHVSAIRERRRRRAL